MAAFAAVLGVSMQAPAAADHGPCTGPFLIVKGSLPPSWAEAVDEVRTQIGRQPHFDTCAQLVLIPLGSDLLMHIALADGRAAFREVRSEDALWPTLRAVLLLPPPARSPDPPSTALDPPNEPSPEADVTQGPPKGPERATPSHLDLGFAGSARIAGAPLYGGAGATAFADVLLDSWLVGVYGRWDIADDLVTMAEPGGFSMQSFGVGVLLGRRMAVGHWFLDGMAGPEIVVDSQEGDGPGDGVGGEANDVRLDLGFRLSGPDTSHVRFYVAADVDASPARIRRSAQIDPTLPVLPSWSSGLALGIIWSPL